jgi:hypothetical protein
MTGWHQQERSRVAVFEWQNAHRRAARIRDDWTDEQHEAEAEALRAEIARRVANGEVEHLDSGWASGVSPGAGDKVRVDPLAITTD